MKKRYDYVLLETTSYEKEFYYCLSDGLIYEMQTIYGRKKYHPVFVFIVCIPLGIIMALILCALYNSTSSSVIWVYMGCLVFFTCVLFCGKDFMRRQKKLDLMISQKSLSCFGSYLPLIREYYKIQRRLMIICPFLLVIFALNIDKAPFPCLVFFSFFAMALYFLIFRVGIFNKKKVIEKIQKIDESMQKQSNFEQNT